MSLNYVSLRSFWKNLCVFAFREMHLRPPHQPELEYVDVSAALDGLVPRVIGDVVLLILLEQVAGTHLVASLEKALQASRKTRR